MELIACICIANTASMHAKNKLHRLTRYTVRETRVHMRRFKIIYSAFMPRINDALIKQRIHRHAIKYDNKGTSKWSKFHLYDCDFNLPNIQPFRGMTSFRDITIVASESIYLPEAQPSRSWLAQNGNIIAYTRMTCVVKNGKYRYRMKLPTRFNPICLCCISLCSLTVRLEENHKGLRPNHELKNVIDQLRVKMLYRGDIVPHECKLSYDLVSQTVCPIILLAEST